MIRLVAPSQRFHELTTGKELPYEECMPYGKHPFVEKTAIGTLSGPVRSEVAYLVMKVGDVESGGGVATGKVSYLMGDGLEFAFPSTTDLLVDFSVAVDSPSDRVGHCFGTVLRKCAAQIFFPLLSSGVKKVPHA